MKNKIVNLFILIFFVIILEVFLCPNSVQAKESVVEDRFIIGSVLFECEYTINSSNEIENLVCTNCEDIYGEITIPAEIDGKKVISLGKMAFRSSHNITKISIPDSVIKIGDYAFEWCNNLVIIEIPETTVYIGTSAFRDCNKLENIIVEGKNANYLSEEGILFNKDKTKIVCYPAGKSNTEYEIPNTITVIGDYAFASCINLTNITIPNSVAEIGELAFGECKNLTSITIPDSVIFIGGYAFAQCEQITDIIIPNSVTSMGEYAFCGCSNAKSLTISNALTSIEDNTFLQDTNITNIIIPDGVKEIGSHAFESCTNAETITIPNSVISIGKEAFKNCTAAKSITLSNSITSMGESAFSYCKSIKNITIPNGVTHIGTLAFSMCTSVESITIPNSVTFIGNSAFASCEGITDITIPSSVTTMGGGICSGCFNLNSISVDPKNKYFVSEDNVIFRKDETSGDKVAIIYYLQTKTDTEYTVPSSVKNIGSKAFCSPNLKNLIIQDGTTSISSNAFWFCGSRYNPFTVVIPDSVKTIDSNAFWNCSNKTIYCNKESYAEQYAIKYNISYKYIMTGIKVERVPYRLEYCAGENFNKEGMVVKKVRSDGSEEFTLNYTIIDGTNLAVGKENVVINVSEAGITVSTTQPITVLDVEWEYNEDKYGRIIDLKCKSKDKISGDFIVPSKLYGKTVYTLGENAFDSCTNLTSVNVPDCITSMGSQAFYNCDKLKEVGILNYNITMADNIFNNKENITIYCEPSTTAEKYAKDNDIEYKYLLRDIKVRKMPSKLQYNDGDDFDTTGMVIKAMRFDENYDEVEEVITDYIVVDGKNLTAGKKNVTIIYKEAGIIKETTQDILVLKKLNKIKIVTTPSKVNYLDGDNFDKTGMVVKAVYSDESEKEITDYTITDGNNLSAGKKNVTISYTENDVIKTVSQPITVIKKLMEIKVTTEPTKVEYSDGDNFDKTGMVVKAVYSDESEKEITDYTITDGNNLSVGKENVTISYTENDVIKTVSQPITVIKKLMEIKVTTEPTKVEYSDGDNFDKTGMVVKAVYSDESEKEITDYTITDGNNLSAGKKNVTISYTENDVIKTVLQPITVIKKLIEIKVTTEPTKVEYLDGDNFDKTGMIVKAVYSDESEEEIENYSIIDGENLTSDSCNVTIVYTEGEIIKNTIQKIEVNNKQPVTGLKVMTEATKTKYVEGENFDKSGLIVKAIYEDGSERSVKKYSIIDGEKLTAEKKNVTVSYVEGPNVVTTTIKITVVKIIDDIEWTYEIDENNNIINLTCESKEKITGEFTIPETIDGKKVTSLGESAFKNCSNVTKIIIPDYINKIANASFENCKKLDEILIKDSVSVIGTNVFKETPNVVIYCYEGSKAEEYAKKNDIEYKLIIDESKILTDVIITKQAIKTEYEEGETFDITGLEVKAIYKDKHEQIINDFKVLNGDKLKAGQDSVTISYTENKVTKTILHAIKVNKKVVVLNKIIIATPATKTIYTEGENFDKTGMEVKAIYSDGSEKVVTEYTIEDGENLTLNKTNITLVYTENGVTKNTTQEIMVNKKPKELSGIKIVKQPTKVVYTEGEDFDIDGLEVIAVYDDNSEEIITDYTVSGAKNLTIDTVDITISYTDGKTTKTTTQAIAVNKKENSEEFLDNDTLKVITKNGVKYLVNILPKYSISSEFMKIIKPGYTVVVKDIDGTIIENKEKYIGTGMKIVITKDEETTEYIAVVLGDCTGDGCVNAVDLIETVRQYKKKGENLTKAQRMAIKATSSEEFNAVDLLQELRIYKKSK